jgi:hypothetical protein
MIGKDFFAASVSDKIAQKESSLERSVGIRHSAALKGAGIDQEQVCFFHKTNA